MTLFKKRSLFVILTLLCAICFAFVGLKAVEVNAQTGLTPVTLEATTMDEHAQIRLVQPTGIRFVTKVGVSDLAKFENTEDIKVVTMITPARYLKAANLSFDEFTKDCGVTMKEISYAYDELAEEIDGVITVKAVLLEVQAHNITEPFVARTYITDGEKIGYAAAKADSIYNVAKDVIEKGLFDSGDVDGIAALERYAKQDINAEDNAVYMPTAQANKAELISSSEVSKETIDGVNNPLKVTVQPGGQTQIKYFINTLLTKQDCIDKGYTNVKIRLYVDSNSLTEASKAKGNKSILLLPSIDGGAYDAYDVELDKWVEFDVTIDKFYTYYQEENGVGVVPLFTSFNFDYEGIYFGDNFTVYFDAITAYAANVVYMPTAQANKAELISSSEVSKETIDGVNNPLKVTVQPGGQTQIKYFINTLLSKQDCINAGYNMVKIRLYVDSNSLTEASKAKGNKSILLLPSTDGGAYDAYDVELDKWVEFDVTIDKFYTYYQEENGVGVVPLFTSFNFDYEGIYFGDNFTVYFDAIIAYTNNLVMDTENVETYTQGITYQTAAIGGVESALKLTVGAGGQQQLQFLIKPNLSKKDCQDSGYTHAKLRVYIDSQTLGEESKTKGSKFCIFVADYNLDVEFDKWVEIELTIDRLYAAFNSETGFINLFSTYNFDYDAAPYYYEDVNFNIYFDDIIAFTK